MNKIEISGETDYNIDGKKISADVSQSLRLFGLHNAVLELSFVSVNQIHELNLKFRQINSPTDVLSFPQTNPPKAKTVLLGNIVVSPEIVAAKGESITDVIKHGLLHLLGFDHEADMKGWNIAGGKINCQY